MEVRNRFKGLDLIDRVLDELWSEVPDTVQETGIKTISMEKKRKKSKMAVWGGITNSCERKRSEGEKEGHVRGRRWGRGDRATAVGGPLASHCPFRFPGPSRDPLCKVEVRRCVPRPTGPGGGSLSWHLTQHCPLWGREAQQAAAGQDLGSAVVGQVQPQGPGQIFSNPHS